MNDLIREKLRIAFARFGDTNELYFTDKHIFFQPMDGRVKINRAEFFSKYDKPNNKEEAAAAAVGTGAEIELGGQPTAAAASRTEDECKQIHNGSCVSTVDECSHNGSCVSTADECKATTPVVAPKKEKNEKTIKNGIK